MLQYVAAQVVLLVGLGLWLGAVGVGWFLFQSALAVLLLENINYLEHYGLQRSSSCRAPGSACGPRTAGTPATR